MHVVIADPIHEVGVKRLESAGFEVRDATDLSGEQLDTAISKADALIVRSATEVTAARIAEAPSLKVIARAGIGVDNIDLSTATSAGVQVVNAPTGGVDAVTEHTFAMAYALVRALPWTDQQTKSGKWPKSTYDGGELIDCTFGVVGFGRIGRSVAERAIQLGIKVLVTDPHIRGNALEEIGATKVALEECAKRADILSIHTPLTEDTSGMIDERILNLLEGGYLINVSRGGIVDEEALVSALEREQLAGAGIDVFEDEPLEAAHPLTTCERILLTPHIAGTSDRAQRTISESVADQIIAVNNDEPVVHPVNNPTG